MNIAVFLKEHLKNIPPGLGQIINHLPYEKRPGIGKIYKVRRKQIEEIEAYSIKEKQDFVFRRIKELVDFSYEHIKFYREYYDEKGFSPNQLQSFSEIQKIPLTSKSILNSYDLESRSFPRKGRYLVNTGGSSGTPFGFYIEPDSMGHEWAHMHAIWEKFGYTSSDFKIVFGGRSDIENLVTYDVVRNNFALDIYAPYKEVCAKLLKIARKFEIKYLHGYPSSIYDFAVYCSEYEPELTGILRNTLKGVFLGSEYPQRLYREKIYEVFGANAVSWYGHTERCVLANEKEKWFEYYPFLTYGFTEAIRDGAEDFNLVATSYYNYASPLIRYNTEDLIEHPIVDDGILKSFEILKGRSGEFVIDKDGKKINLTALIFGRHHPLFTYSNFIQVKQMVPGKIQILFVSDRINEEEASQLFDIKNLNFDISFKKVSEPVRTVSGKISLLIRE